MAWTPSGSTLPWFWGRYLRGRRRSSAVATESGLQDRRQAERLALTPRMRAVGESDWRLVDLGPAGLAIEVRGEAPFSRGEKFSISILGGSLRAEVEGEVRWTRSGWSDRGRNGSEREFFQTAGFWIGAELTPELEERWQALRHAVASRSARVGIGLVSQKRALRNNGVVVAFPPGRSPR